VNWKKIRAEYIAGGISQRAIAEKYGISQATVERRAKKEKWTAKRRQAEGKSIEKVTEKKAEVVADNAVMLERIKTKLLKKLDSMVDAYPDKNVAEMRKKENGALLIYRMKDLAAVYSALEEKTLKASVDIEDLSPLAELLRDE
jgi:transposase